MPTDEKIDFTLFLKEYLDDAKDGFQRANDALLVLEKDRSQTERLDEIGRVFHTLKSSSSMLGFDDIADLAHSAEDLLERMKKGDAPVTQEAIDLLFEIMDTLEKMVRERGERKETQYEGKVETQDIASVRITELKKKIGEMGTVPGSEATPPRSPSLIKRGMGGVIEKIDTVRVKMGLLDAMFNQVGELIIAKNRLDSLLHGTECKELKEVCQSKIEMSGFLQNRNVRFLIVNPVLIINPILIPPPGMIFWRYITFTWFQGFLFLFFFRPLFNFFVPQQ